MNNNNKNKEFYEAILCERHGRLREKIIVSIELLLIDNVYNGGTKKNRRIKNSSIGLKRSDCLVYCRL